MVVEIVMSFVLILAGELLDTRDDARTGHPADDRDGAVVRAPRAEAITGPSGRGEQWRTNDGIRTARVGPVEACATRTHQRCRARSHRVLVFSLDRPETHADRHVGFV